MSGQSGQRGKPMMNFDHSSEWDGRHESRGVSRIMWGSWYNRASLAVLFIADRLEARGENSRSDACER
jgi:hypothetical protein